MRNIAKRAALSAAVCIAAIRLAAAPEDGGFATVLIPSRRIVLAARVNSTVAKHKFKEGEKFDKGDVLIELDSTIYKQILKRAEAEYAYYKKEAERNKGLLADSAVGEAEYAKSVLMRDSSAASLEIARRNLERCVIRAPFAGRVAKRLAEEFEYVKTSQPLLEIIDDRTLLAVVHLPVEIRNAIHIGSEAVVRLDATGREITGRVREISAEIDPASRSFTVKIAIDNKNSKLVPGMSGTIRFPKRDKKTDGNKKNPAETGRKGN